MAIDLIRVPDDMNGFWRIIWGLETNPWPGVCPMDHAGEKPLKKTWRFTNAVPSWTWHGHEGKTAQVEVFSAASVTDESFTGNSHTTFQGRCLAAIRAGVVPGEIRIAIRAKDYGEAVVCLNAE